MWVCYICSILNTVNKTQQIRAREIPTTTTTATMKPTKLDKLFFNVQAKTTDENTKERETFTKHTHTHTRTREKKKTTNVMNKESRNWAFVERKNSLPDNFNVKSIFSTLLIMYEMHTNIFLSCEYSNCWISRVYLCLLTSVRVCLFFFVSVCPCQVYL